MVWVVGMGSYLVCREVHDEKAEEPDPMDVDAPEPTPFHLHGYFEFTKKKSINFDKLTLIAPDGQEYRGAHPFPRVTLQKADSLSLFLN